ncbi:protease Lon-related BREX system protein BrxL [[Mycobacterium] burgundiense]|uniref:Protease Lon-related BREX system protein BrxL n=1 Tax=[Mycobacterium] burgundiense TaxID=3064286 RepID=A0ABN9N6C4_9MYCO|nr:protease Lon-related BREX system protein BrxL [Mycolicibacterium sp. MU0053]CAJ1501203.1 protease Lon-related BREX system protein BrxL [Mycolicibacterium sp. MU0053]
MTNPMDELDRKSNDVFAGRVVRKDLVRQVKVGANVPNYVLEFLLGKYAASDDPAAIATGLEVVRSTLADNFIRPDESEKAKAELKRRGQFRLIDKVDVRLLASEDKYWAHLSNFGEKFIHIPDDLVYKYDRMLGGGVWSQLDLVYNATDDDTTKRPFFIKALKPIQVAAFSMDEYADGRRQFSRDQWLDLLMRTIGLEPDEYDFRGKLLALTRLIPMVERNFNLIELGPWGTGKSFVYRESSPNAILISGGKVTVPQLFVHMGTGRVGLLGMWDVVAFDEVAGLEMSDSTVVNMLKDYMESGSFARGKEETPAEASIVLIGNTSKPHQELIRTAHLLADLPKAMIDPAFIDRLHFYLPGWEVPKLEHRLFTDHYGFVSDYFSEAMRQLRKRSYVSAIDADFSLGDHLSARDEKSVRKTVSGLIKLLHPHEEWTRGELRAYLEFAMEGRRRIKEQLKKLAAHDYAKTAFSYIERDTGREYWVEVPEQPDDIELEIAGGTATSGRAIDEVAEPLALNTTELMSNGESKKVEFKSSATFDWETGKKNKELEFSIAKTVAGFANSHGGTLLIGVNDDGEAVGLVDDFRLASQKRQDADGYENWLTSMLAESLGKVATTYLSVSFDEDNGHNICRVDVTPSKVPIFIRSQKSRGDFYVRLSNSTRLLNTAEAMEYIKSHWA